MVKTIITDVKWTGTCIHITWKLRKEDSLKISAQQLHHAQKKFRKMTRPINLFTYLDRIFGSFSVKEKASFELKDWLSLLNESSSPTWRLKNRIIVGRLFYKEEMPCLCYLFKKIDNRQNYFIIEREIFKIWMGAQLVFIIEIICIWCVGEYWSFYLKKKPCYQKNYGQNNLFSLPFAALCYKKLYYALMKLLMQGRQNKSLLTWM